MVILFMSQKLSRYVLTVAHLLIWHHGYEGVDFEVRFQGTREECEIEMKKIKELVDDLELCDEDIFGNTIDTGAEWEVFDIVEIENN